MTFITNLILSLTVASQFMLFHPIHVSVCEINQKADLGVLEITLKIFADDFQDVLEDRTKEQIDLGMESEHAKTDSFIMDYLNETFEIALNDTIKELKFVGKEVDLEDLSTWIYFYVDEATDIKKIDLRNQVMVHWFNDQTNVTHIDCNDKLKSTFFAKDRVKESFTYK